MQTSHTVVVLCVNVAAQLDKLFYGGDTELRLDCDHEGRLSFCVLLIWAEFSAINELEQFSLLLLLYDLSVHVVEVFLTTKK